MSDKAGKKRSKLPEANELPGSKKKPEAIDEPEEKKRIKLTRSDIRGMTRDDIITKWEGQDQYVEWLLGVKGMGELERLQETEAKLQQQVQEATRRENVLNMRLATKQQELQDQMTQVHDLKQAQLPSTAQLHSMLMDPAVNLMFQRMKNELKEVKEQLAQAQSDLSAWKFSTDSATGKKLMAKCRMLLQENLELGKQLSQGKVAQLEAEIALQKKYSQELKTAQDELSEFVFQLDEESEGIHSLVLASQKDTDTISREMVFKDTPKMATAGNSGKSRTNGPLDTPTVTSPSTSNEH